MLNQNECNIGNINESKNSCPICLQDMIAKSSLRELECGHYFHNDCINHWFQISNGKRCPICRYDEESGTNAEIGHTSRMLDVIDFDLDLDGLFGNFQTEDGDSVFIYEGARGIIMIRMLNVNIPTGLQLVRLPSPRDARVAMTTQHLSRTIFSRTRSFFRRIWYKLRSCFWV
jgi:hypothetical protein